MAITQKKAREWAERLIKESNEDYEFDLVYENEELGEEFPDEEDQQAIYDEMQAATVTVSWED